MIEVLRRAVGDVIYDRYGKGVHSAQTVFLIVQALKRELSTEYGVSDENGEYLWCPEANVVSGIGSRRDAERVMEYAMKLYDEKYSLCQRLVSKGEQVPTGDRAAEG